MTLYAKMQANGTAHVRILRSGWTIFNSSKKYEAEYASWHGYADLAKFKEDLQRAPIKLKDVTAVRSKITREAQESGMTFGGD